MAELIAGIDLGTTNSEIAFFIDGKPVLIPINGNPIMPSCVGIDPSGTLIVGKIAKNQMVSAPESTILSIKRKMGQDVKLQLGDREITPEEVSALILTELKKSAEIYLQQQFTKAVITVPAFFQDHQRQATLEAGKLAGLDVVRIINEPTAAAVAYDADHAGNQHILVYDLGGGTFDVSLVAVENGVVEVMASHGDTHLGGDDFDELLIDHVFSEIKKNHDIDLSTDSRLRRRIWKAVETTKRHLSDHPFAVIKEEYITPDIHADMEISRSEYEDMILPQLNRTLNCIHQCLSDAKCLPGSIDRIILVGGASRTPLVHSLLEKEINKPPRFEINPDLIVAMGAAAHGAALAGSSSHSILVDITPHTFGTSAVDFDTDGIPILDKFVPVIKRNTPLPAGKTEAFETISDNQEKVDVNIYQGENERAGDNTFIGKFIVNGLSRVPAPNVILLNLDLDLNGILKVTATEKSTGLSKSVVMDTKKKSSNVNSDTSAWFTEPDFASEPAEISVQDIGGPKSHTEIVKAKDLRKRAMILLDSDINKEDAAELKEILEKSREAIGSGEMEILTDYNTSLEDLIFYLED